jgi:hypothetical protein
LYGTLRRLYRLLDFAASCPWRWCMEHAACFLRAVFDQIRTSECYICEPHCGKMPACRVIEIAAVEGTRKQSGMT